MALHLDDRYAELRAGGARVEQASRAALAELSDGELLTQKLWRVGREPIMNL